MFIVIELQTNNGETSNIVTTKNTQDEAESVFHSILAAAAISKVEHHAAVILDEQGRHIARGYYYHGA